MLCKILCQNSYGKFVNYTEEKCSVASKLFLETRHKLIEYRMSCFVVDEFCYASLKDGNFLEKLLAI